MDEQTNLNETLFGEYHFIESLNGDFRDMDEQTNLSETLLGE